MKRALKRTFVCLILVLGLVSVVRAVSAGRPPVARAAPSSCDVSAAQKLAAGGDSDWSHAKDLIVYDQPDRAGVYQLRTIRPDGTEDRCLSCTAAPGAPPTDRHKMAPAWHPSGGYIVVQGEIADSPLSWTRNRLLSELQMNGVWMNLYATTADGSRWWQLTENASNRGGGTMAAHFSADGNRLLWSQLVDSPGQRSRWGKWRLMIADFVVAPDGTPSLQNVQDITPADGGTFFESHGFSPDGEKAIFTSDRGTTGDWAMDLWTMDLATGALTDLTTSGHWEEHASFSPDGRTIVYMSNEPYGLASRLFRGESGTEIYVMDADGANKRQLTHFNAPGFPESETGRESLPHPASWSADGTRLTVTRQLGGLSYPNRELWLLTFAGPCGVAPA